MDKKTFNMRTPEPNEVREVYATARALKEAKEKYKILSQLLDCDGKPVDVTRSKEIFEALNREKMEFDDIMKLHPGEVNAVAEDVKYDRQFFEGKKWWNTKSKSKMGLLGHIPPCVYYARPHEYWKDKRLRHNFFNMYPQFRISTSRV